MYAFKRENWFWKAFQKQNGAKICFDTFMTPLIFISVDFRSSYQKLGSSSSLACFACKKPQKFGCVKHLYLCPRQAWSSGKLKSVSLQKLFTLKFLRRCTNIRLRYTRKKNQLNEKSHYWVSRQYVLTLDIEMGPMTTKDDLTKLKAIFQITPPK